MVLSIGVLLQWADLVYAVVRLEGVRGVPQGLFVGRVIGGSKGYVDWQLEAIAGD